MKIERTSNGQIELRLSDDPDHFTRQAEVVRKTLNGTWSRQLDDFDQSYWDLDVQGKQLTVHREHYLAEADIDVGGIDCPYCRQPVSPRIEFSLTCVSCHGRKVTYTGAAVASGSGVWPPYPPETVAR